MPSFGVKPLDQTSEHRLGARERWAAANGSTSVTAGGDLVSGGSVSSPRR
jgi:hypothetical protein